MRLDLFLRASRLCLRRALAQKLCDARLVLINGKPAKAAHTVRLGDEITLRHRNRLTSVRVLAVPSGTRMAKSDARTLYEVLSEVVEPLDDVQ